MPDLDDIRRRLDAHGAAYERINHATDDTVHIIVTGGDPDSRHARQTHICHALSDAEADYNTAPEHDTYIGTVLYTHVTVHT